MGMLLVFSTETGELLGWIPDGYLQRTRVGALYALAADYLARPDAEEVGLIGSGWQAGGQNSQDCVACGTSRRSAFTAPMPIAAVGFCRGVAGELRN